MTPAAFPLPLRTERITLRPYRETDVDDVYAYQSRQDVCEYLPFPPRSREQVLARIRELIPRVSLDIDGDYVILAAEFEGRVIGDFNVKVTSVAHRQAEIGWVLHPDFQGRGLALEAATAILDLCFGSLEMHRVCARLDPRNVPSARLCERLGMRKEAQFVHDSWFRGAWADTAVYAILDVEWTARKQLDG